MTVTATEVPGAPQDGLTPEIATVNPPVFGVGVKVNVGVMVGVQVKVGVLVRVAVLDGVKVARGVTVLVKVAVYTDVAVPVWVGEAVALSVGVFVAVAVGVAVPMGVLVGVEVTVLVSAAVVGVGLNPQTKAPSWLSAVGLLLMSLPPTTYRFPLSTPDAEPLTAVGKEACVVQLFVEGL